MSQSEVSPMTSGRPSCSEQPNGIMMGGQSFSITPEMFDSPTDPLSPSLEFDKYLISGGVPQALLPPNPCAGAAVGNKTVGRWLKDRREKKKEEARVHNAQLHAAISVAAVAAAVAATAAATAAGVSGSSRKDEHTEQTDAAMAAAATLVATRCVEAAEAMGAERDHLASVISSAVNVKSHGDIMTLTAAAATALRGAATLKARTLKDVYNIAAVLPVEKGLGMNSHSRNSSHTSDSNSQGENLMGLYNVELLSKGSELLKRTRTGDLHWKMVSVYIDKTGQVILKMKSKLAAGALTKKKKKVLVDICKDMPMWAERRNTEIRGEERRYFGLKTVSHRVIEFECKNQREYDVWTEGVSRLFAVVDDRKKNGITYWN